MSPRFVLFVMAIAATAACSKQTSDKASLFTKKEIREAPAQVEVPTGLWNRLIELSQNSKDEKVKTTNEEKSPVTKFEPLTVLLTEKNRGILSGKNYALGFATGAGEIDLRDFVEPLNGSFYFSAEFMPDVPAKDKFVFYLSNSIVRKKVGETIGSGCNSYFDISSAFRKAEAKGGFLVNTSENRHVSALAGTYVFAAYQNQLLHLASLVVRDSGQRALQCRR